MWFACPPAAPAQAYSAGCHKLGGYLKVACLLLQAGAFVELVAHDGTTSLAAARFESATRFKAS